MDKNIGIEEKEDGISPWAKCGKDPSRNQPAAPTISKNDVSTPKRKRQQEMDYPGSHLKRPKHQDHINGSRPPMI